MSGQVFKVGVVIESNIEGVADAFRVDVGAVSDFTDFVGAFDDAFGDQKSGGEFVIVSRGSHHHGDAFSVDANFERIFPCDDVGEFFPSCIDPVALNRSGFVKRATHHVFE